MASDDDDYDDDYDDDKLETPPAGEILNDAFGENDKYKIEDGDGWVEADIQESGDYEAYHIHISYENVAGYAFLTQTIVQCSFPYRKAYDEISRNDEPTETGDIGSDFDEEVRDECRALFGGHGGSQDFNSNSSIEFADETDEHIAEPDDIIISIQIGSDEEERAPLYGLDDINEDLKKLKEIIDSYKKKTTKKDS